MFRFVPDRLASLPFSADYFMATEKYLQRNSLRQYSAILLHKADKSLLHKRVLSSPHNQYTQELLGTGCMKNHTLYR